MVLWEGVARIRLLWSSVQMKRPGPLELVRCDMVTSAKLQWTCVCPYFSLISGVSPVFAEVLAPGDGHVELPLLDVGVCEEHPSGA